MPTDHYWHIIVKWCQSIEEEMLEVIILCVASVLSAASVKLITDCRKQDDELDQFLDEEDIDIDTFVFPPRPECPICMLLLPLEEDSILFTPCCGYVICRACAELAYYEEVMRDIASKNLNKCLFCREHLPKDEVAALNKLIERDTEVKAMALSHLATVYRDGEKNHTKAIELFHKAARKSSQSACYILGKIYIDGDVIGHQGLGDVIIQKDEAKANRLFTRGARLGNVKCLYKLGASRCLNDKQDFAKYFLKAACGGMQEALDLVKVLFISKRITKEKYANALRSFQAVHDEISSKDRTRFNERLAAKLTLDDLNNMNSEKKAKMLVMLLGQLMQAKNGVQVRYY